MKTFKNFILESSEDDYHKMIHTGELPKTSKKPKTSAKSFDDLHGEVAKVRKVELHNDGFKFHHSTSSTTPNTMLKKSGWEHTEGSHNPHGVGSKVVYKHPDGHTATYHHDAHKLVLRKKT